MKTANVNILRDFRQMVADPNLTDGEIEKIFYEFVLHNTTEMDILVKILRIYRPELTEKIALKFLFLLN